VCRTSEWGALNAMYYEKTHDGRARENVLRSLNYATYFAESNLKVNCCGPVLFLPTGSRRVTQMLDGALCGLWVVRFQNLL
jgi:hypothetical protein